MEAREKYFRDYKVKADEYLTEKYELVCKKCGDKRYFQAEGFVAVCNCKCKIEGYEREQRQKELVERMEQLESLKEVSLLGKRYKEASFEKLDLERGEEYIKAVERCKKFCERWEQVQAKGVGIYLYGDIGTGKTLLTACIGNRLLEKGVAVLFTSFLEIARALKDKYSRNESELSFMKNLEQVDLLILDDIGTEVIVKSTKEKSWLQEKIYEIINARYVQKKSTIFSSNESVLELHIKCGMQEKTVDRIVEMSTVRLELRGTSYRMEKREQERVF